VVGDGGAGGFAICLQAGQDLSCLAGRIMGVVGRCASRGAKGRPRDGTRRTGVGCSLSLPARRIPVVYEQRWVSELL
jgi:hypothetical protein